MMATYKSKIVRTAKQAAVLVNRHDEGTLHIECDHPIWVMFPSYNLKICHDCRVEMHDDGSYLG